MKTLALDYNMTLNFSQSASYHHFILRCIPLSRGGQTVLSSSLIVSPYVKLSAYTDYFGNLYYHGFIKENHDSFSFSANAVVQVRGVQGTRDRYLSLYKYKTPLTDVSDEMKNFLYDVFDYTVLKNEVRTRSLSKSHIISFASILCQSIYSYIEYRPNSTTVRTTSSQAFAQKKGVCQDYAHIFCALCREAGVASRYICGTSIGEGSTHAWAEFFVPDSLEGRWFALDPTRNKKCNSDYIILAAGRDYNDCQVDRGVLCCNGSQSQSIFVKTSIVDTQQQGNPVILRVNDNQSKKKVLDVDKIINQ